MNKIDIIDPLGLRHAKTNNPLNKPTNGSQKLPDSGGIRLKGQTKKMEIVFSSDSVYQNDYIIGEDVEFDEFITEFSEHHLKTLQRAKDSINPNTNSGFVIPDFDEKVKQRIAEKLYEYEDKGLKYINHMSKTLDQLNQKVLGKDIKIQKVNSIYKNTVIPKNTLILGQKYYDFNQIQMDNADDDEY